MKKTNTTQTAEHKLKNNQDELIGSSPAMKKVFKQIEKSASVDIPVLLLGDTGTGKELAARAIHRLSGRRENLFIPVNLGVHPEGIVGSVLFGHEKGAFTGAAQRFEGIFERGNNGTVFLDEISSIDQKTQVSLLRLLEQQKFSRLGGNQQISSKARIIAASNENLEEKSKNNAFRKDLFHRLNVFSIKMPLLKNRASDIPELISYFIAKFNKDMQKHVVSISEKALKVLLDYDWPGNVRELKNVIQRAFIVCDDEEIEVNHLPPRFNKVEEPRKQVSFMVGTSLETAERTMIVNALKEANHNRTQAAELLGISRRAVYNKLKKYNLQ